MLYYHFRQDERGDWMCNKCSVAPGSRRCTVYASLPDLCDVSCVSLGLLGNACVGAYFWSRKWVNALFTHFLLQKCTLPSTWIFLFVLYMPLACSVSTCYGNYVNLWWHWGGQVLILFGHSLGSFSQEGPLFHLPLSLLLLSSLAVVVFTVVFVLCLSREILGKGNIDGLWVTFEGIYGRGINWSLPRGMFSIVLPNLLQRDLHGYVL